MSDALAGADRVLRSVVQTHFGRLPPFSAEELASWTEPLVLANATSLAGLEHFTGVRQLGLFGCSFESLDGLARIPWLRELKVAATPLTTARGLPSQLTSLDFLFTLVTDGSEILAHPTLRRANLHANPWSDQSYRALSSRFSTSPERDWRLAVALREKGLAYGALPGRTQRLVIPGQGGAYAADFQEATPEAVEAALADAPEALANALASAGDEPWEPGNPYEFLARFVYQPDKDGSVGRFWTPFASPGLAPAVLEQIARLGGGTVETEGGAIEEFCAVKWPTTFAGTFDWREVWSLQLGVRSDLDEYACKGFVGVGMADGGNYLVLFELNDPVPTDPAVYYLDHSNYHEARVPQIAYRLSEFLAGLHIETSPA